MAPPRVILMRKYQVTTRNYMKALEKTDDDCVAVWSTNGFTSIDDWMSLTGHTGTLTDLIYVPINKRKAIVYRLKEADDDIFVGYLPIRNSDDTSYFFHTCNAQNKQDLLWVIRSLKFRDDLSL